MEKAVTARKSVRATGKIIPAVESTERLGDARSRRRDGAGPAISLYEVPFGEKVLRRRKPVTLHARRSSCGEYLDVEFEDIDMSLTFSVTEDVQDGIEAALKIMWEVYAMGNPDEMTSGAQELRQRLLDTYVLV